MTTNKTTPKELWARQQISGPDVDYDLWNKKRISVQAFSQMSQSCIFTVDVFKERYRKKEMTTGKYFNSVC